MNIIKHVITVNHYYLISFNALNDSEMSTLEEFDEAVEAGSRNNTWRVYVINLQGMEKFLSEWAIYFKNIPLQEVF
jgi:hypothetical protein